MSLRAKVKDLVREVKFLREEMDNLKAYGHLVGKKVIGHSKGRAKPFVGVLESAGEWLAVRTESGVFEVDTVSGVADERPEGS